MQEKDTSRLERLTAILTQLQSKRLITATYLADKYGVSIRTIYRDIRSLEQSGVPIITEEGKGYSLPEGYRLPPVMFTEQEANALITAGKLLSINPDESLIRDLKAALDKIKAVMRYESKEKTEFLTSRMWVYGKNHEIKSSNYLSTLQLALTNFNVMSMEYSDENRNITKRLIEPFALVNGAKSGWYLIAYCRLRADFRMFRLDRISQLSATTEIFEAHKMTVREFYEQYHNIS